MLYLSNFVKNMVERLATLGGKIVLKNCLFLPEFSVVAKQNMGKHQKFSCFD